MPAIRLLLVDDHSLFRESLSRLLDSEPDFHVVAHCATTAEALRALTDTQVDLIMLDYDLVLTTGSTSFKQLVAPDSRAASSSSPQA